MRAEECIKNYCCKILSEETSLKTSLHMESILMLLKGVAFENVDSTRLAQDEIIWRISDQHRFKLLCCMRTGCCGEYLDRRGMK
jgi:hypothetical protein